MGIVYACITPHGGEILPELGGDLPAIQELRASMVELGRRMKAARPDLIVVVTPHGLRLEGYNAVVTAEHSSGEMAGQYGVAKADFHCDREFARALVTRTRAAGIPVVGCNYGALSGPGSNVAMDWGALIPLYFFGAKDDERPDAVLIGPTRDIPLAQLVEFGRLIAQQAEESGKRVAFVASADQGHTHSPDGPYGYDPAADEYDRQIVELVRADRLERLLEFDLDFVDHAKPDSLWQMTMLYGVSQVVPLKGEFLAYALPSYFGMMTASYEVR